MARSLLLVWVAACGFSASATSDDTGSNAGSDAAIDAAVDAAIDAHVDAPADAKIYLDAPAVNGSLSVTVATYSGDVNATNEGTTDWGHWGYAAGGNHWDHKSGGSSLGDVSAPPQYTVTLSAVTASWNNGTPDASANSTGTGIGVVAPSSLHITAAASTTQHVLRFYNGCKYATCKLDVSLSDGSATAYSNTVAVGAAEHYLYTITYNAASDAQTLDVTWTDQLDANSNGFAMLLTATLQ